jgi:hypothetical protein
MLDAGFDTNQTPKQRKQRKKKRGPRSRYRDMRSNVDGSYIADPGEYTQFPYEADNQNPPCLAPLTDFLPPWDVVTMCYLQNRASPRRP